MRHILLSVVFVIMILSAVGCGAIGGGPTPTPTAKPTLPATPTSQPTPVPPPPPTATPVPPTAVPPTATPVPPQAITKQQVNLRAGPGIEFPISGKMPKDVSAVILGKNQDGKWYQLAYPDAKTPAWVATTFVSVTGTLDSLQVVAVAAPPTPTRGAAPTKTTAAAPTQVVPAPKGVIGFVSSEGGDYILNNFKFDGRSIAAFKSLGPSPADLRTGTNSLTTNAAPFAWAPDGSGRVVFVLGPGTTNTLRLINGELQNDLAGAESILNPVWSSDGKKVYFVGIDKDGHSIYSVDALGGKVNKLFPARSGENFRGLASGKWLLFVSNITGAYEIWRVNLDGSGPQQMTDDKRENGSPSFSPDGAHFAYYSKQTDGTYQIMVRNADGSNSRKLTATASSWTPAWSPDSNWIAFASNRGGKMGVYIMDKNGGNVQLLTDKFAPEAMSPGSWR